ncbi:hypothetical protein BAUCODRAFT_52844, partial [Baudoinia panamericana UAMH 10762]
MVVDELARLLRVLRDRHIDIDHDDVAWAFESNATGPSVRTWVRNAICDPCLLSVEERIFHENDPQPHGNGLEEATCAPLDDGDLGTAINALETSTASINRQCQLLEAQKRALQDINAHRSQSTSVRNIRDQRHHKLSREKAQLEFQASELADLLQTKLQGSLEETDKGTTGLLSAVDRILEKDDRLLDGLQKLLPKTTNTDGLGDQTLEVKKLCDVLVALNVKDIRMRVDSAYRAHVDVDSELHNGTTETPSSSEQKPSLIAELSELSQEIDSLAAMAVQNHYREPISRELKAAQADNALDQARWSEYLLATLQYLTARLTVLEEHFARLHIHQRSVQNVMAALDGVLAEPANPNSESQDTVRTPVAPSARGLKPLRLVEAKFSESQDPTAALLRMLSVRTDRSVGADQLAETLKFTLSERESELASLRSSTEVAIANLLTETLVKAQTDMQHLSNAVYAPSGTGVVRLLDQQLQANLDSLETKTYGLGERMRQLDVEKLAALARNKQKVEL